MKKKKKKKKNNNKNKNKGKTKNKQLQLLFSEVCVCEWKTRGGCVWRKRNGTELS